MVVRLHLDPRFPVACLELLLDYYGKLCLMWEVLCNGELNFQTDQGAWM